MFEHRLGLALGKSISEIRALPYDEFVSWKLFYQLEPWGWHDQEYRTAALLTQMWNVRVSKKSQAKQMDTYYRDMLKNVISNLEQHNKELELAERMRTASAFERKILIASSLGIKDVKIDHSSGDKQ
jgi:hypothetical protein